MSVKKNILVLCIILYSAAQVSSLKCLTCVSTVDGDCYKNPKKTEFEKTCPEGGPFDCCTVTGTIMGVDGVSRSCQPKSLSEEAIKKAATDAGMTVKAVHRCETDLCNFSDTPGTPSSTPLPTSSSKPPATSPSQPPASSSSKPPAGSSSTHSPGSSTTSAPGSSGTLSVGILSFTSSLIFLSYCK